MSNLGEGIEERTAARVTKEVTKELNAKHAKHAKELTEKLAEKDRIISAYQLSFHPTYCLSVIRYPSG